MPGMGETPFHLTEIYSNKRLVSKGYFSNCNALHPSLKKHSDAILKYGLFIIGLDSCSHCITLSSNRLGTLGLTCQITLYNLNYIQ